MDELRIACVPDLVLLSSRLRDAVQKFGRVLAYPDVELVLTAIVTQGVHCTVVSVDGHTFDRDIGGIRKLRESFPSHPIVVWCEMRALTSRQLLEIAGCGVSDIAFRELTDSRHAFAQTLAQARQRANVRQLDSRLSALLPLTIRPFFVLALERAGEPLDVERAAAALGVTRRTLHHRLIRRGLPKPRAFLVWCRLLAAANLLNERGRTLDSVAAQLNFSSGQNLGAAFRRYLGANITTLRENEVGAAVEAEFRRIVAEAAQTADGLKLRRHGPPHHPSNKSQ